MFGLAMIAALTLLRAADPYAVRVARETSFDVFQQLKPRTAPPDLPIRIIDIDVQGVNGSSLALDDQHPSDGQFGLRDFSRDTVRRRRDEGYRIARTCLSPLFASFRAARTPPPQPSR